MYQRPLLALLLASACSGGDDLPSSEPVDPTSTDTTPALDCSTRPNDIPTARGEMEGVWSPASQRMVFFGGDQGVPVNCSSQTDFVGDTWLWEDDCQNWRQVDGDAPNAMARYAAALDPVGDRMVVFGGRFRNGTEGDYTLRDKTWAFSFATETWTELDAGTGPSARAIHAGVVADGRFIVYGGTGSRSGTNYNPVYDETWAFNLTSNAWEQLPTTGGPGPRIFHGMATDGASRVWLFGGGDEDAFFGPFYSDVWELDLTTNTWSMLASNVAPRAPEGRIGADIVYDAVEERLILWAGHDITDLGNNNQIFAFDLGSKEWSEIRGGDVLDAGSNGFCDFPADFVAIEEGSPERRYLNATALTDDGRLLTFGGKTDSGIINDLWAYDLSTDVWTNHVRATDGESCVRAYEDCSSLCF